VTGGHGGSVAVSKAMYKALFRRGKKILSVRLGSPASLINNFQIHRVIGSRRQISLIFITG